MAEEVKDPRRNLPLAIIFALVLSTFMYMLIAVICVLVVPADLLAATEAPLAAVMEASGISARATIGPIGLVAVVNGALIQIVMAARVLYGMGGNGLAPSLLAYVHPFTRTPLVASVGATAVVLMLALTFPLVRLAEITSSITLVVLCWSTLRR